jgi:aspartyl-tRNA(Asn)/glutamyl-tRNA(Gln) amidotransferase subunit C
MALGRSDVEKIAYLARLELAEQDVDAYARQLGNILDFVEQMKAIDTSQVTPLAHPLNLAARLRADRVTETDQRGEFQAHAPQVEAGLYLVPKVIE